MAKDNGKPERFPEKIRDYLLMNSEIVEFIDWTNARELHNDIIPSSILLDFTSQYNEFWEFVIALAYGATKIPTAPRKLIINTAQAKADNLVATWQSKQVQAMARKCGFYDREK